MLNFQQNEVFMKKYFEILRKCRLFDGIEDENLIAILGCLGARVVSYDKNCTILSEGRAAREIGIVLSGEARVVQIDYFGNRSILADIAPSELFNESFAYADVEEVPVDTVATEDCEIMFVDCHSIMCACCNASPFHQQLIYNLMKDVATKNILFHQKLEITSKRSTREKLMAYLLLQAKKQNCNRFEIDRRCIT
jgi:CRP-like cAMP-binding protein